MAAAPGLTLTIYADAAYVPQPVQQAEVEQFGDGETDAPCAVDAIR
jgi:hypothetical protein